MLTRFGMKDYALGDTLVAKGDKFSLNQCPKNEVERNEMQKIPYASTIGSLYVCSSMYASKFGVHSRNVGELLK